MTRQIPIMGWTDEPKKNQTECSTSGFDEWYKHIDNANLRSAYEAGRIQAAKECAELVNVCSIKRHSARTACDIIKQTFKIRG